MVPSFFSRHALLPAKPRACSIASMIYVQLWGKNERSQMKSDIPKLQTIKSKISRADANYISTLDNIQFD
jgi:hypothetical protein